MNRLTLTLFAAAVFGAAAPSARADRAAMSVRTGGVAISIAADDDGAPESAAPSATVGVDADADANPFVPDVYPSRYEAARAAAAGWARTDPRRWEWPPTRIRVMSDDASLFASVQQGIRARVPGVRVEPCDGTLCNVGTPPSGEAWLYVTLPKGMVTVRSAGWSDAVATTSYVDKPWVSNFADFVSRTPGRWLVARSDAGRPATTPGEAAQDARRAAVDELVPLVLARTQRRFDAGGVRRVVETHLRGDRLVHDRFPQKYERPYGSLYREAVLIDASDARLDALARDVRHSLDAERKARVGGLAGAAAVLLVTYALYRFANAFTRGYFTWSLRTAAAVVAAGAVVLIVAAA